jgi:hypothetical protein
MVSTVTTATIVMVTSAAIAGSFALVGIFTLLALVIQKELASSSKARFAKVLGQVLDIGIMPLLIVFALVVAVRVIEALR